MTGVAVAGGVQAPQWRTVGVGDNFSVVNATIAAGGTLSSTVDLLSTRLNSIWVPSNWTAANLSFQSSPDGINFGELSNDLGTLIVFTVAVIPTFIIISTPSEWLGVRYLNIRSGPSNSPVAQVNPVTLSLFALP